MTSSASFLPPISLWRQALRAPWLAMLLVLAMTPLSTPAQPTPALPVPPLWGAAGVSAYPMASPLLGLDFADIVLPGVVTIHMRSKLQFTQKLVLFAATPGNPDSMTQIAMFPMTAKNAGMQRLRYTARSTQNITLLAQTPDGWFVVERQLKVGHQP